MAIERTTAAHRTLDKVKQQFNEWRQTKNRPKSIPESLWEAAASLAKELSINQVSRELRLNHTALKKRVLEMDPEPLFQEISPAAFVELSVDQSASVSECVVEMEDSTGAKMRMCFRGKTDFDLLELGKAFWRRGI